MLSTKIVFLSRKFSAPDHWAGGEDREEQYISRQNTMVFLPSDQKRYGSSIRPQNYQKMFQISNLSTFGKTKSVQKSVLEIFLKLFVNTNFFNICPTVYKISYFPSGGGFCQLYMNHINYHIDCHTYLTLHIARQ